MPAQGLSPTAKKNIETIAQVEQQFVGLGVSRSNQQNSGMQNFRHDLSVLTCVCVWNARARRHAGFISE